MLILAIVNRVAQRLGQGGSSQSNNGPGTEDENWQLGEWLEGSYGGSLSDFLFFLVVILVFAYSQWQVVVQASRAVEDALRKIAVRIARKITACELDPEEARLAAQRLHKTSNPALELYTGDFLAVPIG